MPTSTAAQGYSGKPLFEKLGMTPGKTVLVVNAPAHYGDLMQGVRDVSFTHATAPPFPIGSFDIAHVFCARRSALPAAAGTVLPCLTRGGALWVSWPKKTSKDFVDLTEDGIRAAVLPLGWVDVKVCAVDPDWSGLKFLERRH